MIDEYTAILREHVKEYELLAKYNGNKDYLTWNVLREALFEFENNDLITYYESITDMTFIQMNYGITDIDIQFVRSFNPHQVVKEYKEWKANNE